MPLYSYRCLDCHAEDQRLAGLDDATAICVNCGGMMLRLEDPFLLLWDEVTPEIDPKDKCPECDGTGADDMDGDRPLICQACNGTGVPLAKPQEPAHDL